MSVAPTGRLCRWACRCQAVALTRIQQVDMGTAKQGSVCLQEKAAAPWERRRKAVTNNCEIDTRVLQGQLFLMAAYCR